jgi:hypothetical protein
MTDELGKLYRMRYEGILTDEEFARAKEIVLAESRGAASTGSTFPFRESPIADAARRFITYKLVTGVLGFVVFLLFFFCIWLPGFTKMQKAHEDFHRDSPFHGSGLQNR